VTINSNLHDTLGMGEACSLCTNVEVLYHYILMGCMVMFNYGHLIVKNDDTKKWLIGLSCMFSIGC
jgi:hypothetical protein